MAIPDRKALKRWAQQYVELWNAGDKEAWAKRAEAGVDALVDTVIKGKGAMPAKGGNASLSEDDIRNAVHYLLEQAGVSG